MCIVFIYSGENDENSKYSLILVTNRDERYDRLTKNAGPWVEDPKIIGGRDMECGCEGGTWMAMSTEHWKLGILLNIPGSAKKNARSRGKIVEDYVKGDLTIKDYVQEIQPHMADTNGFNLISVNFKTSKPLIESYSNITNKIQCWHKRINGFGNSDPEYPLKKVEAGKERFEQICDKYINGTNKDSLIEDLITLMRWEERHLPDPELETKHPSTYEYLSAVYVSMPEQRYGTRTHTIVLVAKTGQVDYIELTMEHLVDLNNPKWIKSHFSFNRDSIEQT